MSKFQKIGLIGKHTHPEIQTTLESLYELLAPHISGCYVEENLALYLPTSALSGTASPKVIITPLKNMPAKIDLAIVIGGDGSFLNAARIFVNHHIPVLGINRGRLGFLTDFSPKDLETELLPVLQGEYKQEKRFLLHCDLIRNKQVIASSLALNDVVLYSGDIARLLEFEVTIDGHFMSRQRADGVIAATPTGSTAYALSGGGPIIHPELSAIVLVPMHPLTLSSRPIVLYPNAQVEWHIMGSTTIHPKLSCDGQVIFTLEPDDKILIKKHATELTLIHPNNYDYYHTLRTKLGWNWSGTR
jgi:NAD+ kinase